MNKSQELKKAAAETASAAAEYSSAVLRDSLEHAQELITEAQKQAAPILKDAKVRTADFAARTLDDLEPHIVGALDKVSPAVDAARDKVADDLLPRLQDALHQAAENPTIKEATRRSTAAVQALKGELEPAPKKKSKLAKVGKALLIGTIVAGAIAAIRHFLAPKDDGWTAHEPSKAYVNNNDTFSAAAKFAADSAPVEDEIIVPDEEAAEQEEMTSEGAPPPTHEYISETDAAAHPHEHEQVSGYGEGSYVGAEPPEGYSIKGNERSMKFHLPGTGGYERTIAEVWFNSEEAAQAAGFTKAQR